jgi:two-component system sensor histidine kinase MprB
VARNLAETDSTLADIRNRLWLLGLAVTALGATLGWLAARRMARPIERLSIAAEHVARTNQFDGVLDPSIDTDTRGEVGRLAGSFASMLDVLHRSRQQQQQLVMDAGHELRTPLTTLRTNVEMLERGKLTPDDQRAVLKSLRAEIDELADLTNELVELATDTRAGDPPRVVDVFELAVAAADRASSRFQRQVDVAGEPAAIDGQVALLERAIDNLLENAAKFSPPGTPIDVTVGAGQIEVRDHGPGIDAADLPHVFDRFYRANTSRTLPGSGLGLAIVAKAAAEHGGVSIARNAGDGGAIVGFTFGDGPVGSRTQR